MIALDPVKDEIEFICKADLDLPDEEQTRWILKPLSAKEHAMLDDHTGTVGEDGQYIVTIGKKQLVALNLGLKDVFNFNDSEGKPVKLSRSKKKIGGINALEDSFLMRVPKEVRVEIAQAIMAESEVEEEEAKNS